MQAFGYTGVWTDVRKMRSTLARRTCLVSANLGIDVRSHSRRDRQIAICECMDSRDVAGLVLLTAVSACGARTALPLDGNDVSTTSARARRTTSTPARRTFFIALCLTARCRSGSTPALSNASRPTASTGSSPGRSTSMQPSSARPIQTARRRSCITARPTPRRGRWRSRRPVSCSGPRGGRLERAFKASVETRSGCDPIVAPNVRTSVHVRV